MSVSGRSFQAYAKYEMIELALQQPALDVLYPRRVDRALTSSYTLPYSRCTICAMRQKQGWIGCGTEKGGLFLLHP